MKLKRLHSFLALGTVAIASPTFADSDRLTGLDVASMSNVSGVSVSPDGERVVYSLTRRVFDREAEFAEDDEKAGWTLDTQIWIVDSGGGDPIQLTYGDEPASQPRISPDGNRLAFVRVQDEQKRLLVLSLGGGEAQVIEIGNFEPGSYAWSPDGERFAFLAEAPQTDEEQAHDWASGGAIDWNTRWRLQSLWTVPVDGDEPHRVSAEGLSVSRFAWSPDGTRFLVATSISSDPYYSFSLLTPRVLSAEDGAILKTLLATPTAIGTMAWSPDGQLVAFEYADGGLSLLNSLAVHEVEGRGQWNAVAALDPTLAGFFFASDSRSLIAHIIETTDSSLYRLSIRGDKVERIGRPGRVLSGSLVPSKDRRLFASVSSTTSEPPDPTVVTLNGLNVDVVANVNPQMRDWRLGEQSVVSWKSPEGRTIEGVLFRAPLSIEGKPGPLLVLPHGGPDSVTTNSFSAWAHYFASLGLSVLRPNYRGGLGYGFEFYAANRGRLGEIEFMDIESGVDSLIAHGIADPEQLFYGGWSWGGYLTSWTIGHTNRYRSAVAGAAVVDTVNQYVLSDINHGVAAEWEYTTTPWENFERFDAANPMRFLHQAETPTLIIHGQADGRVPFPQGLTLYRALADSGVEVEMLAYPREPHGFKEPAHTRHMLEAWAAWYQSHGLGDQ